MLGESGTGRLGGKAAALGTGRHRRRLRCRGGRGREGRKEEVVVLERKAGGGGGMPAEGGSIGVHRHPAREAWGSPEKIGRGAAAAAAEPASELVDRLASTTAIRRSALSAEVFFLSFFLRSESIAHLKNWVALRTVPLPLKPKQICLHLQVSI
jgi:hypothetical protein